MVTVMKKVMMMIIIMVTKAANSVLGSLPVILVSKKPCFV